MLSAVDTPAVLYTVGGDQMFADSSPGRSMPTKVVSWIQGALAVPGFAVDCVAGVSPN